MGFRAWDNDGGFTVPLVSIYIPAYNAEDTIVGTVQSALDQTVRDLEVCVVNDGSTDATLDRLSEHFSDEPRVRIGNQENAGIGAASNHAVRMCRGAYIGQLDADDELTPDAVERMLAPMLADTRIGVSYGSHVKVDANGDRIGDAWTAPRFSRFTLLHIMIVHHFRLFRARDWNRTTGFAEDIRNAIDYDMFLKMSEVTEMVHVDERVYRYRVHGESTSQKHQPTQYRNHALVVARALERRGLAADWTMEPLDNDDPRKYRFVKTQAPRRSLESPMSPIDAGGDRAESVCGPTRTDEPSDDPLAAASIQRRIRGGVVRKNFGRVISTSRQIAAWYASPSGLISAVALLVALGLAGTGHAGAAVWVLVAWLGGLIPYKLSRERAERARHLSELSEEFVRSAAERSSMEDSSLTPTVEKLAAWQEILDRRCAVVEARIATVELREPVDEDRQR
ncbi:glycosyltransferase family 2 protein [Ilumatobacter sp.]|uniref:glycosyltransferase family 2 protein n=1 Tax=Ilumatobacter sp. TaxID=1967498 RepID=UPI003C42B49E